MKKAMLLAVFAAAFSFTVSAAEWKIDGGFKQLTPEKLPARWSKNAPTFKQGSMAVVPGRNAKENAVKVESKGGWPILYSQLLTPVKIGEKLEIEFYAKGKGNAYVGTYLYGKAWAGSAATTIAVNSPDKFTRYKTTVTFKKVARPYTNARAIFGLAGPGVITFADLKMGIQK